MLEFYSLNPTFVRLYRSFFCSLSPPIFPHDSLELALIGREKRFSSLRPACLAFPFILPLKHTSLRNEELCKGEGDEKRE